MSDKVDIGKTATKDMHKWYIRLFEIWGILWGLPVHLFGFLQLALLIVSRNADLKRVEWPFFELVWRKEGGLFSKFFRDKWANWGAYSCGMVNVYRWDYSDNEHIIRHERRHSYQTFAGGIFHPIAYGILKVYWFFKYKLEPNRKQSHYDNWFEADADRFADRMYKCNCTNSDNCDDCSNCKHGCKVN